VLREKRQQKRQPDRVLASHRFAPASQCAAGSARRYVKKGAYQ